MPTYNKLGLWLLLQLQKKKYLDRLKMVIRTCQINKKKKKRKFSKLSWIDAVSTISDNRQIVPHGMSLEVESSSLIEWKYVELSIWNPFCENVSKPFLDIVFFLLWNKWPWSFNLTLVAIMLLIKIIYGC